MRYWQVHTIFFKSFLMVALLLLPMLASAQIHSFIRHYGRNSGISGQTWDIYAGENGFVFFANGESMLLYRNGVVTPQVYKTEVRSVYAPSKNGRIFIGGINEFGFFDIQANGAMSYTSLSDSLADGIRNTFGNVWHTYGIDQNVYFVSDNFVFKYNGQSTETYDPHAHIEAASVVDGVLYISAGGVKYVHGHTLKDFQNIEPLMGKNIHGFASYNGGVLAVSEDSGIFFCDGKNCEPFETDADRFLKKSGVFCVADNGDELAIGTVKGGIAVISKTDRSAEIISETEGLGNNTVISLSYQNGKTLWAGLDNSIDEIMLHSGLKSFSPPGLEGAGYDAAIREQTLYLATNRGVFYTQLPLSNAPLQTVDGLTGQAWKFYNAFGQLFCLHDKGLFSLENGKAKNISGIRGFWGIVQVSDSVVLTGTYSELYAIKKRGNEYLFFQQNVSGSFADMAFDGHYVWLHSNSTEVVFRGVYNHLSDRIDSVMNFDPSLGLPADKNLRMECFAGNVYAVSQKGSVVYNAATQRFEPTENIGMLNAKDGFAAVSSREKSWAGLSQNSLQLMFGGRSNVFYFDANIIYPSTKACSPFFINDSLLLVPNFNGFSIACAASCADYRDQTGSIINNVSLADGSIIWQSNVAGRKFIPKIPYNQASIKFNFVDRNSQAMYRYRLGSAPLSPPATTFVKEFTSLREGSYVFYVMKTEPDGRIAGEESFEFVILPPWYRTFWAYAFYVVILFLAVFVTVKIIQRRLRAEKEQIISKAQEDMQQLERQHLQQQLQNDLEHKTNELSDMALLLAGKNEILGSIKNDITEIYKEPNLPPLLKSKLSILSSKIDGNIQNDNLIDRFEEQFNLLHNNFIKKLKTVHPGLSRNDYMLCAYIRMGFSTKEIAQMLNMSVRGVESIKYRFKKKINIETDIGDYLQKIETDK